MSWSRTSRAVAAAALLLSTVSGVAAAQQEDVTGPDNRAHLDAAATSEAVEVATSISTELFTFDYTDLEGHRKRFTELTTGELTRRYGELFDELVDAAATQKFSLTSEVTDAAVRLLKEDRAEVLVFLTQTSTRTDTNKTNTGNAMFLATFTRTDGDWKAADIDTFEEQ